MASARVVAVRPGWARAALGRAALRGRALGRIALPRIALAVALLLLPWTATPASAVSFGFVVGIGATSTDTGSAVAVDGAGNVYVTGEFTNTADFQPGSGTTNLTSAGAQDVFVLKLDTNGAFVWATAVGGVFTDLPTAIIVDANGETYATGSFRGTAGLTFQAGDGTSDATMTFTGTPAAVNAALDGLRYTPVPSFTGPAGIQIRSGLASGPTDTIRFDIDSVPITVVAGSCAPRPPVRVQAVPGGGLAVTLTSSPFPGSQPNPLSGLRFGSMTNARVTLNGQPMAANQAVPLAPGATQVAFTVQRDTPGQPVTVPLTVVDVCGPWPTFVGAGTGADGV